MLLSPESYEVCFCFPSRDGSVSVEREGAVQEESSVHPGSGEETRRRVQLTQEEEVQS